MVSIKSLIRKILSLAALAVVADFILLLFEVFQKIEYRAPIVIFIVVYGSGYILLNADPPLSTVRNRPT